MILSVSLILFIANTISSLYEIKTNQIQTQNDKCVDASGDCRLIAVKCLSPNRIEQKLMEISCPMTCGYCIASKKLTSSSSRAIISSEIAIVPVKCTDEADDCVDRISFCQRKFYKRMMTLQ
uniref:ShKT domain-containing protein n=1 Tax=Caenorhabditis japonica TaxID=281687 RepID=A0A8R1DEM8_CAEJA